MSEPRFTTLTPETMTTDQKRVADAIQSGPRGAGLRGPFNALLRSPELCDLVQRLGAFVRFGTSIPPRLNEMAIIMAGRKWTAQYEFYAHRRLAIEAGLKPAIADAIAAGTRPTGMAEDEAIVYDFVNINTMTRVGDHFIASLNRRGITPVIPPKANRKSPRDCDFALYCERNLVERFFNKLKHYRAIATRYDNLARNFLAGIQLVSAIILLN